MAKLKKTRSRFDKADFTDPRNPATPLERVEAEVQKESKIMDLIHAIELKWGDGEKQELLEKLYHAFGSRENVDTNWFTNLLKDLFEGPKGEVILGEVRSFFDTEETENGGILDSVSSNEKVATEPKEEDNLAKPELQTYQEEEVQDTHPQNTEDPVSDELEEMLGLLENQEWNSREQRDVDQLKKEISLTVHEITELMVDGGEEFQKVKELDKVLRNFLAQIENFWLPVRKSALASIANFCNKYFEHYEFISPETYPKVEPAYHNVVGPKGTRVKVGLSFLVVRKGNKQLVFKADVKTY